MEERKQWMGGKRRPSAWRSAAGREEHTHKASLPCERVEGERRQLQGAHQAVRARAPSSGAASARRCSIGRTRESVFRRRSRVLPP